MTHLIFVKTKLRMQTKEYRDTKVQSTEIKEYKNTVIEKYGNIEVHKSRYTDLQIYKNTGKTNRRKERNTKKPEYNEMVQASREGCSDLP